MIDIAIIGAGIAGKMGSGVKFLIFATAY